jgi:hypothetical protein
MVTERYIANVLGISRIGARSVTHLYTITVCTDTYPRGRLLLGLPLPFYTLVPVHSRIPTPRHPHPRAIP